MRALVGDAPVPYDATLEEVAELLEPEQREQLIQLPEKHPRGERNLKQALDSMFPEGW